MVLSEHELPTLDTALLKPALTRKQTLILEAMMTKLAVTFPGQGSQSVGMGQELAQNFAVAKSVFDEVDDALGQKLSQVIWEGPVETLTLTANAQPALMAVSIAVLRVLESEGFNLVNSAQYVAGHSLGEYSALCAAGSFSLSDTAHLLRIRGDAMQEAVPVGKGAMAAIIGLEFDQVTQICQSVSDDATEEVCQIANDNGGGQLVISGSKKAVESATELATEKGAKRAIILPVSAPFHSAMMAPAAEKMQAALYDVEINAPSVPLIANVLACPIHTTDEIRKRLVEQVTGQVRWRESVEFFNNQGIETLLELGSGKVLTGLARRISRDIKGIAIGNPADIEKAGELYSI